MIILDLEVIDFDRVFEQLVLDFFDNDVFTIDENENITRAEVRRIRPALGRTIERVRRRGNDFLTVDENVRQLGRKVLGGFPPNLCAGAQHGTCCYMYFFTPKPCKIRYFPNDSQRHAI